MMPFERRPDGRVAVRFSAIESDLLDSLARQVCEMLGEHSERVDRRQLSGDELLAEAGIGGSAVPSSDPAIARLLPDAYSDDAAAAGEFRRLTERGLCGRKIANARTVIYSLGSTDEIELDGEAQQAWLRSLTDIRLVLATRLGIEKDEDAGHARSDDDLMMRDVYDWLAAVQSSLIEVIAS